MNKIKRCPFCGGEAEFRNEMRIDPPCHYNVYYIRCKGCGISTPYFTNDGYYGEKYTEGDVIAVWNRRAEV